MINICFVRNQGKLSCTRIREEQTTENPEKKGNMVSLTIRVAFTVFIENRNFPDTR